MKQHSAKPKFYIMALGFLSLIAASASTVFAGEKLSKLQCSVDQIAKYDGSGWVCAADNDTPAPDGPDGPCFSDNVTAPPGGTGNPGEGRYFDCNNGTVTDTVTGLIMLKNASCLELLGVEGDGTATWVTANEAAAALEDLPGPVGDCGLEDNSSAGDWRIMTKDEWLATVKPSCKVDDQATYSPALPSRFGFGCYLDDHSTGVEVFDNVIDEETISGYWSSTTDATRPWTANFTDLDVGVVAEDDKTEMRHLWPVR